MKEKTRKIVSWILAGLVAFALVGSGMAKLSGGEQAAEIAKGVGGVTNLTILGILEIAIAAIWLVPRTGLIGGLLAIAYMGGAIAVHFISNQPVLIPVAIQILIWVAAAYRFPEITKRLFNQQ